MTEQKCEPKESSYILYEWETKRASLDFEIGKVESQLRSLEKRLRMLRLDVIVCVLLVAIPYFLILLVEFLHRISYSPNLPLPGLILEMVYTILIMVYIITLPFSMYQLIKSGLLLFYNTQDDDSWQKPHLRSDFLHRNTSREDSYNTEINKLNWVLAKYYVYRDEMDRMKEQMEKGIFQLTYEETRDKLNKMEYYEEIKPASPFVGGQVKKARIITVALLSVIFLTLYFLLS